MFQQQQPQQHQQQQHSRQRASRVPLACAYDGYFVHPAYGPVHVDIHVRLESTAEGSWQALGQNQRIAVQRHSDGRILLYDKEDAETQLEGVVDMQTGVIVGEVIQSGERGGRFVLESVAGAALAPKAHVVGRLVSAPGLRLSSRDFGGSAVVNQTPLPALLTSVLCAGGPPTCGLPHAAFGMATVRASPSKRAASCMESQPAMVAGASHQAQSVAGARAHASYSPAPVFIGPQATVPPNPKRTPRQSWLGPLPPAAEAARSSPRIAAQAQQQARVGQLAMVHQHVVAH